MGDNCPACSFLFAMGKTSVVTPCNNHTNKESKMNTTPATIRLALDEFQPDVGWLTHSDLTPSDQELWNKMVRVLDRVSSGIRADEQRRIAKRLSYIRENVTEGLDPVITLNDTPASAWLRGFDIAADAVDDA